jgi:hypothetical protein
MTGLRACTWSGWTELRRRGRPSSTVLGAIALRPVLPAPFRGPVVAVLTGAVGGDLEVLAKLLIPGLLPQRRDVLSQLVPVEIEAERVEQKRLGDEVVERQDADLLEEMCKQDVVVWLQALFQKAAKRGGDRLAVKH